MIFKKIMKFFTGGQDTFFQLLIKQSEKTLEGMQVLIKFMEEPNEESSLAIDQLEHEADEIRRTLIETLNKSFVTPIDREDIFALSREVDDILDYGYSTVDEMVILNVKPNDNLKRMVIILEEATNQIHLAVLQLGKNSQNILEHATRAKKLENRVEGVYRKALAELFNTVCEASEILEILKMREIYRHLSNAADRIDEAANVLSDVAVKTT